MTMDSLTYLLSVYWPFVLGALAIGLGTGWLSLPTRKD